MKVDKAKAQKDFDAFLTIMDDQLAALKDMAEMEGITLDDSIDDCPKLEKLFSMTALAADKDAIPGLIVLFARQLGEIVVRNYNGIWALPLDDSADVNYNTPVITGHSEKGVEFAPISVMRSFALRKKPGTLFTAIDADIHISPINLDDLLEKERAGGCPS